MNKVKNKITKNDLIVYLIILSPCFYSFLMFIDFLLFDNKILNEILSTLLLYCFGIFSLFTLIAYVYFRDKKLKEKLKINTNVRVFINDDFFYGFIKEKIDKNNYLVKNRFNNEVIKVNWLKIEVLK